jgi:signal peptidase I
MKRYKMNKIFFIIILILSTLLVFLNFVDLNFDNGGLKGDCFQVEEKIVRGHSFSPYINPGTKIEVLLNYYDCQEIKRGDIVLFNYAGNKDPLIKVVKGIPGDKFELIETIGGWNIVINNSIVKNFENQPYIISGNKYKMLSLYERDYNGVIPVNAYLLLSNQSSGSIDSTVFGLVDKSSIIAKVKI